MADTTKNTENMEQAAEQAKEMQEAQASGVVSFEEKKTEKENTSLNYTHTFKAPREIEGKKYLLELPLRADYAFIRPSVADKFGNYYCSKATKNFNYVMAGASKHTIIAPEKLVEVGEIDPDYFAVAGVLVDTIVEGEKKWQI